MALVEMSRKTRTSAKAGPWKVGANAPGPEKSWHGAGQKGALSPSLLGLPEDRKSLWWASPTQGEGHSSSPP